MNTIGLRGIGTKGFTLIELTLVAAIIGLLAAIAIPKFGDLIERAREAREKANLGAIRSAIHIYYADTEGSIPVDLYSALYPKYVLKPDNQWRAWPLPKSLGSANHPLLHSPGFFTLYTNISINMVNINNFDGGDWLFIHCWANHSWAIFINCTHTDTRNRVWSTY